MQQIFRMILLPVLLGCLFARPLCAGGDIRMHDGVALTNALEEATQQNDITRVTALITENRSFVTTKALSKPLSCAIQTNNPALTLLFLSKGSFNPHKAIPNTKYTPLIMAIHAQATDVECALIDEYTYTEKELTQALKIMDEAFPGTPPLSEPVVASESNSALIRYGLGIAAVGALAVFVTRYAVLRR